MISIENDASPIAGKNVPPVQRFHLFNNRNNSSGRDGLIVMDFSRFIPSGAWEMLDATGK
jgi:hypothetical protein